MQQGSRLIFVLAACGFLLVAGVVGASASAGSESSSGHPAAVLSSVRAHANELADRLGLGEDEGQGVPGTLDDGEDLLPQAKITIDEAIEAAKAANSGEIGEIDLEHYQGQLVFNVDVGDRDVKVDAENGSVLSSNSDD